MARSMKTKSAVVKQPTGAYSSYMPDEETSVSTDELVNPERPDLEPTGGWLPRNLKPLVKGFRRVTFNSPIAGALATAALTGLAGYHAGPMIDRILSPRFGQMSDYYDDEYTRQRRRKAWAWAAAALGGLAFLSSQFSTKRPGYGLLQYHPMGDGIPLQKTGSGPYDSLTLDQCSDLIMSNPNLTPTMRMNAMSLLNSFNAPPSTPVSGGSLVGQAIGTGLSAASGAAVGYLTASVLGLPNPSSTAILGAVQNTLGTPAALMASTVFGH